MFLEQALKQSVDLSQPLRVLDLCAAPGGKSTHLLSMINEGSLLVANEAIRSRATILAENILKWGNINVVVTNNDPEDFQKLEGFFDVILVDAPCSGEGLFRKDANAVQEWSEESVELCALRQQRILNQIWPALKQDGILIYCTCTYNEKENEENIGNVFKGKEAESIRLKVEAEWGVEEIEKQGRFGYRFYPHKVRGEGFFISVIRKKEEQKETEVRARSSFYSPPKKISERSSEWMLHANEAEFVLHEDLILALPGKHVFEIDYLTKVLKVIQKGTAIATIKHDKLIPEHSWALSTQINKKNFPIVELTLDQAISFLRKDAQNLVGERGFTLIEFEQNPIGWANLLGNRTNNLYPSAYRIRSEFNPALQKK